jgi:hypothetical protein
MDERLFNRFHPEKNSRLRPYLSKRKGFWHIIVFEVWKDPSSDLRMMMLRGPVPDYVATTSYELAVKRAQSLSNYLNNKVHACYGCQSCFAEYLEETSDS